MAAVTVATLLTRIRDCTDTDDDQFVDDAMLLRWLNNARPRLDSLIARAGWVLDYDGVGLEIDGSETEGISLGVSALAILGVYEVVSSTQYRQLRPTTVMDDPFAVSGARANRFFATNGGGTTNLTRINLRPLPSSGLYSVLYLPVGDTLVTGTPGTGEASSVYYPNGWEEWLVLEVARQVSGREESLNMTNEDRKREIEKDVERMAGDRMFAQGPKVRNVDGRDRDNWRASAAISSVDDWFWL